MGSGITTAKPVTSQSFSKPVTEKRKKSTEITNSTHGISESNNSRSKKTMSQLSRAGTLSSPHHVDNIDASRDIDGGGKSTSQMIEKPGVYKSTISVKSSSQRAQTDRQKITTDSSSSTKRPKTKAVFEIIKRFEATSLQETEIMMAWLDEKLKHLDTKVQSDDRNLKPDAGVNGNEEGETQNIDVDWKKMRKDITGYKSEKQRLLNVISEIAGNRLKSNNPAIADLSDKNRASKLAEKFSELYDNEWTDVVEVLRTIKSNNSVQEDELERKSISYMVDVIKISYQMCQKKAKKDLDKMIKVVVKSSD
ncbi:uncharacterized protein LOC132550152, partial [Ylistrum balloti]|uniref:uncharacterized protein LOC132550152 n=1 Tax=Ylistrum balloti TaxID=509963 RepID=UPI002905EC32